MDKIKDYLQKKPEFMHATVGYIYRHDQVLLGIRKRVSFGLGEQLIAGIGGKLEKNETDEEALRREFIEEINVKILSSKNMGKVAYLFPHKPKWNQIVSVFLIDKWQSEPKETDDIQPLWFKKAELPNNRMWPDNLYTIPLILSGKRIHGTFLYNEEGSIDEYELEDFK